MYSQSYQAENTFYGGCNPFTGVFGGAQPALDYHSMGLLPDPAPLSGIAPQYAGGLGAAQFGAHPIHYQESGCMPVPGIVGLPYDPVNLPMPYAPAAQHFDYMSYFPSLQGLIGSKDHRKSHRLQGHKLLDGGLHKKIGKPKRSGKQRNSGSSSTGLVEPQPVRTVQILKTVPTDSNKVDSAGGFPNHSFTSGFIFRCSSETLEECMSRYLFGGSANDWNAISHIKDDTALFLFDTSTKTLHGVFVATEVGFNLEEEAWNHRFPSQARVRVWHAAPCLENKEFIDAIGGVTAVSGKRNWFKPELSHKQVRQLLNVLKKKSFP